MSYNNNRNPSCNSCRENRRHHCGCMRMARGCWGSFPYYGGPCPDTCGCYGRRLWEDEDLEEEEAVRGSRSRRRRCRGGAPSAVFTAFAPMALSPNGIVPLAVCDPCRDSPFKVNSGLITLESEGTYLATYNVRVPTGAQMDTLLTLNVNNASQSPAITQVVTEGGETTQSFTAQTIFQADADDTVSLRTSEAVNVTDTASSPMFTLSLVRLDD